jgi:hypothetical protein
MTDSPWASSASGPEPTTTKKEASAGSAETAPAFLRSNPKTAVSHEGIQDPVTFEAWPSAVRSFSSSPVCLCSMENH